MFVAIVGGVLGFAAVAAAYWSANVTGVGSGGVGTLDAPALVTAAGDYTSTVAVQWTSSTAPDGGAPTGYYVTRDAAGSPSAACGSSPAALITPATNCADTNVPDGTYTYTVTAIFRGWTATSTASGAVVVDAVDHFDVSAPAGVTSGTAFSVTATAKDALNNTVVGYTGTVHFATTDAGSPVLPSDYTFVGGDAGTHTFTNAFTLQTATSQSITVNDTVDNTKVGTTGTTVAAGAAAKVAFTTQPGGGTGGTALGDAAGGDGAGRGREHGDVVECERHVGDRHEPGWRHVVVHDEPARGHGGRLDVRGLCDHVVGDRLHVDRDCGGSDVGDVEHVQHHGGCRVEGGVHDPAGCRHGWQRVGDAAGGDGAGRRWEHGDVVECECDVGDRYEPGWWHVVVHDEPARGDGGCFHVRGLCDHVDRHRLHVDRDVGRFDVGDVEHVQHHGRGRGAAGVHDAAGWRIGRYGVGNATGGEGAGRSAGTR